MAKGILKLKIVQGKLHRTSQTFYQLDPFLILDIHRPASIESSTQLRTKLVVDGGHNPVWNETFEIEVA